MTGSISSNDLPSNISFGTVRGRFGTAVIVSIDNTEVDPGNPEPPPTPPVWGDPQFQAIDGLKVTFTAAITYVLDRNSTPPVTIVMDPVICAVDEETGYLTGADGQEGVKLIATDDPDLEPHGNWTYLVTFDGAPDSKKLDSFSITVPKDSDRYLTSIAPVQASPGISLSLAQVSMDIATAQAAVATAQASAAVTSAGTAAGSAVAGAASATTAAASSTSAATSAATATTQQALASTSATNAYNSSQAAAASATVASKLLGKAGLITTIPRYAVNYSSVPMTSGTLRLGAFVAPWSTTVTRVRAYCGSTAAAVTPNLIQFGVWQQSTVAAEATLDYKTNTVSDLTLFKVVNTLVTAPLATSLALVAGEKYWIGLLVISSVTTPTVQGVSSLNVDGGENPSTCYALTGQSGITPAALPLLSNAYGSSYHPYLGLY